MKSCRPWLAGLALAAANAWAATDAPIVSADEPVRASAFADYRGWSDEPVRPWRDVNRDVTRDTPPPSPAPAGAVSDSSPPKAAPAAPADPHAGHH